MKRRSKAEGGRAIYRGENKRGNILKCRSNQISMVSCMVVTWSGDCLRSYKVLMIASCSCSLYHNAKLKMVSCTIMLPRAILVVVLGIAGTGEDLVLEWWKRGVVGLEDGWTEASGTLAENVLGSESCQRTGAVRDDCPCCGVWLYLVHCRLHWLFSLTKIKGGGMIYLCCCLPTICGKHLERLMISNMGKMSIVSLL